MGKLQTKVMTAVAAITTKGTRVKMEITGRMQAVPVIVKEIKAING